MPALLTSTSIDLKRDSAVSTILAAVAGSPMWPSTRATRSEGAISVDCVIFRELATTLKPRSTKPLTIPAPIPCEEPVTMAVFHGPLMVITSILRFSGTNLAALPVPAQLKQHQARVIVKWGRKLTGILHCTLRDYLEKCPSCGCRRCGILPGNQTT